MANCRRTNAAGAVHPSERSAGAQDGRHEAGGSDPLRGRGRGPSLGRRPKSRRRRHFLTPEEGFVPASRRPRRAARAPRICIRALGRAARQALGMVGKTERKQVFFTGGADRRRGARSPGGEALTPDAGGLRRRRLRRRPPGRCGQHPAADGRRRSDAATQAKSFSFAVCFIPPAASPTLPARGRAPGCCGIRSLFSRR